MTPPFRQITNEAFSALVEADPEKAIAYIRSALQAGELEAGQAATQILVFRQANLIRAVVSKNVRADLLDEVCDGASLKAIEAVLANPPELANLKQLRGWVAIIARRHVASVARDGREQIRRELSDYAKKAFKAQDVKLDAAIEQEKKEGPGSAAKSKKASRMRDPLEDDDWPDYDIQLQEAVRIASDWTALLGSSVAAAKETKSK